MWHKPCRTFHPWCPCIKTRCLSTYKADLCVKCAHLHPGYAANQVARSRYCHCHWTSLSGPVVVQHHGHLTLTLNFQGQIQKILYLSNGRADWHGMKGMWIDRMLHPLYDFQLWPQPWPWPWIFKVKFWKSRISGMGWAIDMEWKGCESIECWTRVLTFNIHLNHDLDLGFSRSNFEKVVFQEWDGYLTWNKRDVSR